MKDDSLINFIGPMVTKIKPSDCAVDCVGDVCEGCGRFLPIGTKQRTKQEEIRELIELYAQDECFYLKDKCKERGIYNYCISEDGNYSCLMKRLDSKGVVIKGNGLDVPGVYEKVTWVEPLI